MVVSPPVQSEVKTQAQIINRVSLPSSCPADSYMFDLSLPKSVRAEGGYCFVWGKNLRQT